MIKKFIPLILLFPILLFSSNQAFKKDIERYLEKDFYKFGIEYNKNTDKLVFSETDMLFENGKSKIRRPFVLILDNFFPRYLELLIKHKVNIKQIIIKGHTSSVNRSAKTEKEKYYLNKILSQERADAFLDYSKNINHKIVRKNIEWINMYFESNGMSSSELIYDNTGKEDEAGSRRIELEVIFNDELKEIPPSELVINKQYVNTIYLADYVKRLLVESDTLKEKYNLLKSFESEIKIANASFYPTATLNFKHTEYQESEPDKFTDTQSKDITLRYNVFNGFYDTEESDIRTYNYKSKQHLTEQIEGDLVFSLTEVFIGIKRQKDILKLSQSNLEDYDLWIAKEDIKFQNGMISLRNYAKIQSRDTTQRMNYRELYREYKDNISTFSRYLDFDEFDVPYFEELNPISKYLENKDEAQKDIVEFSPYVKESEQIIQMYKEKLEQSKVNFYPIIDLIAKKRQLDEHYEVAPSDETKETSIALEAKLEFYSGGKDKANHEKKLFEYREKLAKREAVIRDVNYRLDLAYNKYELAIQKKILLENLILKREDSLLGASYDYKFAKIDANELLDAVDDLYVAKKLFIENKYDMLLSKYQIFNHIGLIKNIILENEKKD